ncbi:hypothetical protein SLEP1_g33307 [Rubroshorea leprosula]|uniref:Uncharacterized protein n=1 Tax=Rubroshorea leprosula TaxID=152421 RepID=A0AAV5KG62_9ROSI|nr:hypothetical protein SLEP1_g33307 [Rubroshorea leprosula]
MERKIFLQHREKTARSQSHQVKGNAHASTSCSSSGDRDSNCSSQAAEFACSACVCCVSCPISIVWCCVKLPCKIGWRAVKNAVDWVRSCGSGKQVFAEYSSFSDIDSDRLPRRTNSSSDLIGSKGRIAHRGNG